MTMAGVKPTTAHNNSPQQRPTTTAMAEEATITAMVGRSSKEMRKCRAGHPVDSLVFGKAQRTD
jgi:hypothetical protein